MKFIILLLTFVLISGNTIAQELLDYKPKILLVTAHPDDDAIFSATVWKTTQLLGGTVDLALLTNGEGGFRYSTLGNYVYGLELDSEEVGRANLPTIRKKELIAGGDIMGLRNYFFFDLKDFYYTQDVEETFDNWDTEFATKKLFNIMEEGEYDFLFLMLPFQGFHGHHNAATVLALEAMSQLPEDNRPIALQAFVRSPGEPGQQFSMLEGYPKTKAMEGVIFEFDRNQTFGYNDRMNYNIISNWVIAEHKSQGVMQMRTRSIDGNIEQYWYIELNGVENLEKTKRFFEAVNSARPD